MDVIERICTGCTVFGGAKDGKEPLWFGLFLLTVTFYHCYITNNPENNTTIYACCR